MEKISSKPVRGARDILPAEMRKLRLFTKIDSIQKGPGQIASVL